MSVLLKSTGGASRLTDLTDIAKIGGGVVTVWVNNAPGIGDDASAVVGRQDKPFATLTAAANAAEAVVDTFDYTVMVHVSIGLGYNELDIARHKVNWYLAGASIDYVVEDPATNPGPIFDTTSGTMTFKILGSGSLTMTVSESDTGLGGGGDLTTINLANVGDDVTIYANNVANPVDTREGASGQFAIISNGTLKLETLDVGTVITSTGITDIKTGTAASLTCSGGMQTALAGRCDDFTCSGGTQRVVCAYGGGINRSGGSQYVTAQTASSINVLQPSGIGEAVYNVSRISGSTTHLVAISTPIGVTTRIIGLWVTSTTRDVVSVTKGTAYFENCRIRSTAGSSGDGVVVAAQGSGIALKLDFKDCEIIADGASCHGVDVQSDDLSIPNIRIRFAGGNRIVVNAATALPFSSHHQITFYVYDNLTVNVAEDPFTALIGGSGDFIVDSALAA